MPARLSIVDLSDFEARKQDISRQLLEAATGSGFFYVTGHGISKVPSNSFLTSHRMHAMLQAVPFSSKAFVPLLAPAVSLVPIQYFNVDIDVAKKPEMREAAKSCVPSWYTGGSGRAICKWAALHRFA